MMNFEYDFLTYDELEINIKRILMECKKKIKWICLASVILGALFSAIDYVKDVETAKNNAMNQEMVFSEADYVAVENYYRLKSKVDYWEEYENEAPSMRLKCNDVCTINLQYYISAETAKSEDVGDMFISYISSPAFKDDFAKKANLDNTNYIDEIYEAYVVGTTGNVINIDIIVASEQDGVNYEKTIQELVLTHADTLAISYGDCEITLLNRSSETGFSQYIYDLQEEYYIGSTRDKELFKNCTSILSREQRHLINVEEGLETEATEIVVTLPKFSITYIIKGLEIGLVLSILLVVVYAVFDGKLQSENEIKKRFGHVKIGTIKKRNNEERFELMTACISKMVQNCETDTVSIISTVDILDGEQINKLYVFLNEKNIRCELIGNVANKETLVKLSKTKPAILVEEVGKSKVKEIYKEVDICNELSKEILGYICITE